MKIALASFALLGAGAEAHARQVYCYATVQRSGGKVERALEKSCTIYLTPVFQSDQSEYGLAAEFSQALPDAGLSTCVTDEYQADLPGDWQAFIENSKADNCALSMQPPPGDAAYPQPRQ